MSVSDKHPTRVHGNKSGGRFEIHLVELLGNEGLDVPLDRGLRGEIRLAIAKCLLVEVEDVKPIATDLILA